ncbi:MAG: ADP-ribosylglycohydrolase family protein [Clostridia bacterium]|nr:ADP-ribosylglycohydrolase family protein [Clostridia bacterium]
MNTNPNYEIKLNINDYRDKVYACWLGKNIGGTMGAPYEGTKEYLDVQGFVTRAGEVLPNDDLDLQLVWLAAVERCGIRGINPLTLGEFWLSFIGPHWNEYGIGKANMKMGLIPPLAGDYRNEWKHSNGAWIRTEIWACLEPGRPDYATKYAQDDACVDHGTGEGTYAAIFVSAMQSAAFALSNVRECIEVGLSKIPADCRMAQSIRLAIDCYEQKLPPRDAREKIRLSNADIGDGWFEAPSNVAYTVLGLLYGEGDFKKSMIIALNCGDDTDCTGATVGATLGILYGTRGIPADWAEHLGDDIITLSIDKGTLHNLPKTCTELTERVLAQAKLTTPVKHVRPDYCYDWQNTDLIEGATEIPTGLCERYKSCTLTAERLSKLFPDSFEAMNDVFRATVILDGGADVGPSAEKKLRIRFEACNDVIGRIPLRLTLRWWLPDGWRVTGENRIVLPPKNERRIGYNVPICEYTLTTPESLAPENRIVLEAVADGRPSALYLPVVLMG